MPFETCPSLRPLATRSRARVRVVPLAERRDIPGSIPGDGTVGRTAARKEHEQAEFLVEGSLPFEPVDSTGGPVE